MRIIDPEFVAAMTIWGEARGESYEGKLGVAEVIRNRTAKHVFSDGTIEGTCLRNRQFSCWNHGDPNRVKMFRLDHEDRVFKQCLEVWKFANEEGSNVVRGAVNYFAPAAVEKRPTWASPPAEMVAVIGRHEFYRL